MKKIKGIDWSAFQSKEHSARYLPIVVINGCSGAIQFAIRLMEKLPDEETIPTELANFIQDYATQAIKDDDESTSMVAFLLNDLKKLQPKKEFDKILAAFKE